MWAQGVACILGIWLMAAPEALSYGGTAAVNDRIIGPLAASFAGVALWQVSRGLRWINVILGLWLLLAPLLLGYAAVPWIHSVVVGVLLSALSLVKGRTKHRYDGGWQILFRKEPKV